LSTEIPGSRRAINPRTLKRGAARAVLFALAWAALTGADPASWIVGAPVVLAAAAISAWWLPPAAPAAGRWRGAPAFLWLFLNGSLRGGLDVARRAFDPRLPIAPGFVPYRTALPPGPARVLFANVVCLLPGTVVTGIDGPLMEIHALDVSADVAAELRRIESRVAGLFEVASGTGAAQSWPSRSG